MDPIKVPYLSYSQIDDIALGLLAKHGRQDEIPVQIEEIIEFDFGLTIELIRGLRSEFGIDGYLTAGVDAIVVDEWVFDHRPNRCRFTLAHELGHLILHRDVIEAIRPASLQDWAGAHNGMSDEDYGWFEYHAYSFAGAILVPRTYLVDHYGKALQQAQDAGAAEDGLSSYGRSAIAGSLAKSLAVSTEVVRRRIDKLRL